MVRVDSYCQAYARSTRCARRRQTRVTHQRHPQFAEGQQQPAVVEEGPIKVQKIEDIPAEPPQLALEGFRWVTVDITNEQEMQEVYKLLNGHYVEDNESLFRFNYSPSMLKW